MHWATPSSCSLPFLLLLSSCTTPVAQRRSLRDRGLRESKTPGTGFGCGTRVVPVALPMFPNHPAARSLCLKLGPQLTHLSAHSPPSIPPPRWLQRPLATRFRTPLATHLREASAPARRPATCRSALGTHPVNVRLVTRNVETPRVQAIGLIGYPSHQSRVFGLSNSNSGGTSTTGD